MLFVTISYQRYTVLMAVVSVLQVSQFQHLEKQYLAYGYFQTNLSELILKRKSHNWVFSEYILKLIVNVRHSQWYFHLKLENEKHQHSWTLQWRHNVHDGVSNHRRIDGLLNRLLRSTSKKTSSLCVTGLCEGNSPVIGEFSLQRASNVENVSIRWRHHEYSRRHSTFNHQPTVYQSTTNHLVAWHNCVCTYSLAVDIHFPGKVNASLSITWQLF